MTINERKQQALATKILNALEAGNLNEALDLTMNENFPATYTAEMTIYVVDFTSVALIIGGKRIGSFERLVAHGYLTVEEALQLTVLL